MPGAFTRKHTEGAFAAAFTAHLSAQYGHIEGLDHFTLTNLETHTYDNTGTTQSLNVH